VAGLIQESPVGEGLGRRAEYEVHSKQVRKGQSGVGGSSVRLWEKGGVGYNVPCSLVCPVLPFVLLCRLSCSPVCPDRSFVLLPRLSSTYSNKQTGC
jgi:hypothetical protein